MATNILDRYGIKEVADVTFYELSSSGQPTNPVLYLDTLKVSTIEQTAEEAEARGGKGNAKLIVWDFGKEFTVNIEDALFSPKSLSIMFADGAVVSDMTGSTESGKIRKSARLVATTKGSFPQIKIDDRVISTSEVTDIKYYDGNGTAVTEASSVEKGDILYASWLHPVAGKSVITIKPDSFPGTYYVTGDTMIRSERTGEDEYFQFVIPKAKMQAEQTITMEADGDPSTFNMSLQVLRPENKEMIKFIKYEFGLADNALGGGDWTDGFEKSKSKTL